ncbi:hypothetical protein DS2_14624 [Catenovulum agarivorans DS-2]|uniref:Uncharacterized protein n=1 Tax=Catenovulum agarivorans DS-2 TaxID=1328313 RepID=W7QJ97_9ALTE|nr:hypothetical protein [Catenovulum agarivorans]EWH09017.1 hypothetical protein DS2_14624 [Catenovulum agarivorans DS-2]
MYKKNPTIKRLETWLEDATQEQQQFIINFLSYNQIDLGAKSPYINEALLQYVNKAIVGGGEEWVKNLLTTMKSEWRIEKFKNNKQSINISLDQSTYSNLIELCRNAKIPNSTYSMVISELVNTAHKRIKKK